MRFEVYHVTPEKFRDASFVGSMFPDDFIHVATVTALEIGPVYQMTNHIYSDWTKGSDITMHVATARSTSVSDVVVAEDGTRYVCAPVGWVEFTGNTVPAVY